MMLFLLLWLYSIFFLTRDSFGYSGSFVLPYDFKDYFFHLFKKNDIRTLMGDCTEYEDPFW
jgi:hypothetical protein